jgi:hypothetical protein
VSNRRCRCDRLGHSPALDPTIRASVTSEVSRHRCRVCCETVFSPLADLVRCHREYLRGRPTTVIAGSACATRERPVAGLVPMVQISGWSNVHFWPPQSTSLDAKAGFGPVFAGVSRSTAPEQELDQIPDKDEVTSSILVSPTDEIFATHPIKTTANFAKFDVIHHAKVQDPCSHSPYRPSAKLSLR